MARKQSIVSDLSGQEIMDGTSAVVTIRYEDRRRGTFVLDVTEAEADELGAKGRKQMTRGRKPKHEPALN